MRPTVEGSNEKSTVHHDQLPISVPGSVRKGENADFAVFRMALNPPFLPPDFGSLQLMLLPKEETAQIRDERAVCAIAQAPC